MLRKYSRELHGARMLADVCICAGIFVALALHPFFGTEGGLADLGLAAIVGMGLVTGAGWQIILWQFRAYESNRRGNLTNLRFVLLVNWRR
jgi:hypothetical protein